MDIVIYTNPETLLHKRQPDFDCYWSTRRPPKNFKEGDRIWFAVKGEVHGSFLCNYFDPEDPEETIEWKSDSWEQNDEIEEHFFCKPFRGFRYRWWK